MPFLAFDGVNRSTRTLSRLVRPGWRDELSAEEVKLSQHEFIQAAGSSEKMTVEIRKTDKNGDGTLFTVGRLHTDPDSGNPGVEIRFGSHALKVYEHEVFDAEEAAKLFYSYYNTGDIPPEYYLRAHR
ncbi:hypothetical protein [Gordonia polyisoprenivorans]|uniref:hypothetical protein n=1 Tax=Gordonia polyisoprenivorans TaxID=84595 RepID=UPI001AD77481|nr:hypothetical protein [Gordonia polyisoprenivorans]QTI69861.1 hypothetical protein J6U32_04490 [Gordonia polyisoprenivorans]